MKKEENIPYKFESISQFHGLLSLPKPTHPLISLIDNMDNNVAYKCILPSPFMLNFYKIAYKPNLRGKFSYGQSFYDFDEGGLVFASPNQVAASLDDNGDHSGYTLFIHSDFLLSYPLAKRIKEFGFFSYSTKEALYLSDKEKTTIISIFKIIDDELQSRIDDFSQDVIISQIESLLNYSNRFYKRQFITHKTVNNDLVQKMEEILDEYFNSSTSLMKGIPTVQFLSEKLNISSGYLSDMLRSLTGNNAQQHIHNKLVEKAKQQLSIPNLTVSEIAYQLGFEHPQSFSRFFKTKTKLSPLDFRQSFN